ncbi:hypothetical protein TNCV_3632901 [Trichonephila clavipes]|nr:hypothetical protein TNCV_3632901 [Trichonephila clavipes]
MRPTNGAADVTRDVMSSSYRLAVTIEVRDVPHERADAMRPKKKAIRILDITKTTFKRYLYTFSVGKKDDLSSCKKAEVKALVNANFFSNREISRRLKVSEASVRRIKKKIESGEELSLKRKKKCGRKSIFTPRSERSLKKICFENRFATTKVIKSHFQDINANASERTVRRKFKDLNFKTCCPARKPKLTPAIKAKRLN